MTAVKDNIMDQNVCGPTCISLMALIPSVPTISKHKARKVTNILIYTLFVQSSGLLTRK